LASVGFKQAIETGERLKSENIDTIISSPFLRTVQTANIIAEKLGKKFILEAGLSEWLSVLDFNFRPELDNPADLVREYSSVIPESRSLVNPVYPEDNDALDKRIEKTISEIIKKYGNNILVISHGSPLKSIFKVLIDYEWEEFPPMCSVSMFSYSSGNWKLVIQADSSHLTSPDNTRVAFYKERWADLVKSKKP